MAASAFSRASGHVFLIACEYVCAPFLLCRCLDRLSLHLVLLCMCVRMHVRARSQVHSVEVNT